MVFGDFLVSTKAKKKFHGLPAIDHYTRLTTIYSQFRSIGVNYNQVVKHLKATFTEKMALALLYKLEKATIELVTLNREIMELTRKFEEKYLKMR